MRSGVRVLLAVLTSIVLGLSLVAPASADDGDSHKAGASLLPLLGWRIALDPGHNGSNAANPSAINAQVSDGRGGLKSCNTTGTQTASGYTEHEFNFDVSVRVAERLQALGAKVFLTRDDDNGIGPCVDVRGRFAEDVDADLLISIHANGSTSTATNGFFAIVSHPAVSDSQGPPSLDLAADLIDALAASGLTPSTAVEGGLSMRSDLATLNFARRPSVMLELGEMRNAADAALMESEEGRQQYADAIVAGILAWSQDHSRHTE